MDLDGRVALDTGASRGIGAAIAGRLAEAGVDMAVGYANDRAAAEEQIARISGMGRRAVAVGSDVSDPAALKEMVGDVGFWKDFFSAVRAEGGELGCRDRG